MVSVYEKGEKILEIFKGTEGPYRIENEGPWGGYTVKSPQNKKPLFFKPTKNIPSFLTELRFLPYNEYFL